MTKRRTWVIRAVVFSATALAAVGIVTPFDEDVRAASGMVIEPRFKLPQSQGGLLPPPDKQVQRVGNVEITTLRGEAAKAHLKHKLVTDARFQARHMREAALRAADGKYRAMAAIMEADSRNLLKVTRRKNLRRDNGRGADIVLAAWSHTFGMPVAHAGELDDCTYMLPSGGSESFQAAPRLRQVASRSTCNEIQEVATYQWMDEGPDSQSVYFTLVQELQIQNRPVSWQDVSLGVSGVLEEQTRDGVQGTALVQVGNFGNFGYLEPCGPDANTFWGIECSHEPQIMGEIHSRALEDVYDDALFNLFASAILCVPSSVGTFFSYLACSGGANATLNAMSYASSASGSLFMYVTDCVLGWFDWAPFDYAPAEAGVGPRAGSLRLVRMLE